MSQWRDPNGKQRRWEAAERTTRRSGGVDGVAIIARVTGGGAPPRIVLEKQFRPPQGNYVIEVCLPFSSPSLSVLLHRLRHTEC